MGGNVSICARQRNESCNAKNLLNDRKRMVALYDEIMEYGREELNFRRLRNKIPLEVILCFFKAEKNAFLTTNFVPPGLDGDTVYSLTHHFGQYAQVREKSDGKWCRASKRNKNKLFIASDDNVGDQKILKGEFIRAKDKLLCQPGIRIKKKIPLDAWEAEFEKMDSGVRKNEYVSFHEFCQYAVKELTTPEKYLADYKKDDFVVRPQYPPLYDDGINYQKSLLKHKRLARAQTSVTLPTDVHIAKRLESLRPEASFFNNKAELENASSTLLHERDKELLSPSESLDITDTISNCSKQTHEPNQFPTPITDVELIASREKQAPIISMSQEVDLELSSPREIQENSMVVDYSHITDEKDRSVSILLASRGRIRPFSAPPPRAPKCSPAPKPDCKLLQPTVFNGRHILSVKKAKKKKYNIFHQYKLDRDAESNCTPRKYVPQKKILKNELPKKPLSPTTHRIATAADGGLSFCSSIHSHATLRVHFPSIYVDEKASPCSSSHVDRRLSCDSKIDDGDECSIHDSISEKDNPEENSIVKPNYDEIPTYKEPDHTLLDFLISLNYCG